MSDEEESSQKEEIFQKLKDILDKVSNENLGEMTIKSIGKQLIDHFGEGIQDKLKQFKGEMKDAITERALLLQPAVEEAVGNEEKEEEDEEEEEEEEDEDDVEDEEEEDEDHPDIAALPEEWKAEFETVMWVKTNKQFPWWPSLIYNPSAMSKKLRLGALKHLGKKHACYFYGSNDWDYALPTQMKPFLENIEQFSAQKIPKRYQAHFITALELAKADIELPKADRAKWNHKERKRPTKKVVKTVAKEKASAPKKAKVKSSEKASTSKEKKTVIKKKKNADIKNKGGLEEIESTEQDDKLLSEEEVEEESEEEEEFDMEDEDEEEDDDEADAYVDEKAKKSKKSSSKRKAASDDNDEEKSKKKRARSSDKKEKGEKKNDGGNETTAKKVKKILTNEEKEQRIKEKKEKKEKKERDLATQSQDKKRKASAVASKSQGQPLTAAQKKKLQDEKNALEKSRISAMKSSSEPVWKQARASLAASATSSAKSKISASSSTSSSVAAVRAVETPVQRARRLCQLIEVRIKNEEKKEPQQFETAAIIKIMRKARDIELSLTEWAESKFIELLSGLRKYQKSAEIAKEAKEIRSFLKEKMTAMTAMTADIPSANVVPVAPSAPSAPASDVVIPSPPDSACVSDDKNYKEKEKASPSAMICDKAGQKNYHQLAVELIVSERSRTPDSSTASRPPTSLSTPVANIVVDILENLYKPTESKDNLFVFMSAVHKFAFAINDRVRSRLVDLAAPLKSTDELFVTNLAQVPVSEW